MPNHLSGSSRLDVERVSIGSIAYRQVDRDEEINKISYCQYPTKQSVILIIIKVYSPSNDWQQYLIVNQKFLPLMVWIVNGIWETGSSSSINFLSALFYESYLTQLRHRRWLVYHQSCKWFEPRSHVISPWSMTVQVRVVKRRTVCDDIDWRKNDMLRVTIHITHKLLLSGLVA